jgi:Rrf2 family protein
MALRITRASDYAVRAMIHLACLPEERVSLRHEIAEALGIPTSFMAKILRRLVRAHLLRSSRGVHGGFSLGRPAAEISLLDILEAVEGPIGLTDCTSEPNGCVWTCGCPAAAVWERVQDRVRETLAAAVLEELVSTPRRHGEVLGRPIALAACGHARPDDSSIVEA